MFQQPVCILDFISHFHLDNCDSSFHLKKNIHESIAFQSLNFKFVFRLSTALFWHLTVVIYSLYQKIKEENQHQSDEAQNDPFEV